MARQPGDLQKGEHSGLGWPGQLLLYSEISPGGVLSLVPPKNTTVPKAGRLGFVLHIGWYTVLLHCPPFSSRPFKGHGKFWCWSAPCSPFSQERQAEEQQSSRTFPVSATTGVRHYWSSLQARVWGVSSCVLCLHPWSNGRNPGRPAFPREPHRVLCALPPDPQNLTVGQLQSSFPKVIYRWQVEGGGVVLHSTSLTCTWGRLGISWVSPGLYQLGTSERGQG